MKLDLSLLPPRFREKFIINEGGCWVWTAGKVQGYGTCRHEGEKWLAHRLSYTLLINAIPPNMVMDHFRINPGERHAPCSRACVNPEHLEIVTLIENIKRADGYPKGTFNRVKTHCPQGHKYSRENTYHYPIKGKNGFGRKCRICVHEWQLNNKNKQREYDRKSYLKKKRKKSQNTVKD